MKNKTKNTKPGTIFKITDIDKMDAWENCANKLIGRKFVVESQGEAEDLIQEAQADLEECLFRGDEESAENICQEYFGLEPDYLIELL